ncbi:glycerate kinase [Microvirga sp. 3-52]|uniref:glycerate kinase type-2 family protein n=1 Tax=Microvirga sp. 3-52 TaxID=2792425 RepID=UPI001AC4AA7F|nr:glycerate kinase [Microvirga sp. 3-52]MBO1906312.1 glycerate kinase [Microvirga sp. 3-52]MBS7453512.1 glycerate kinase [Microvirga sp. 3-52]
MPNDAEILYVLFDAALKAALPDGQFDGRLPPKPAGRTIVLGAGKASARMAAAFEEAWGHVGGTCEGLVVTRYGHAVPTKAIEIVEAAHPVPDEAGVQAAGRILALAQEAGPDDLVVCLMSGGASALLSLPAEGVTLVDKQNLNRALLKSGAPIGEMNLVRKSLSAIKGGRLAGAVGRAQLVTYLISDVPGDYPGSIGSGPTIPERVDPDVALGILRKYGIEVPDHVVQTIRSNAVTEPVTGGVVHMLSTPKMALDAAAAKARELGLTPLVLGDALEGEAREVGRVMAGIARSALMHGEPAKAPCVLLSGGETTVTVRGRGRGGRNAEFLLSLALALKDENRISAIACDTDGIDGSEDNAGAWFDGSLFESARAKGIDLASHLDTNDAYTAFAQLDRLVMTGPTLTNVNDFRCILIRP